MLFAFSLTASEPIAADPPLRSKSLRVGGLFFVCSLAIAHFPGHEAPLSVAALSRPSEEVSELAIENEQSFPISTFDEKEATIVLLSQDWFRQAVAHRMKERIITRTPDAAKCLDKVREGLLVDLLYLKTAQRSDDSLSLFLEGSYYTMESTKLIPRDMFFSGLPVQLSFVLDIKDPDGQGAKIEVQLDSQYVAENNTLKLDNINGKVTAFGPLFRFEESFRTGPWMAKVTER